MRNAHQLLYGALLLLYVAHNDWWLWDDPSPALGLPWGLTYHLLYMVATTAVMYLLVRYAWPRHLEVEESPDADR